MGNAEERPKSDRRDRTADMPRPQATAWGFCFDLLCWALPCPSRFLLAQRSEEGQGFALLFILGFLPAGNRKKPFLWLAFGNRSPVKYYGGKSSNGTTSNQEENHQHNTSTTPAVCPCPHPAHPWQGRKMFRLPVID